EGEDERIVGELETHRARRPLEADLGDTDSASATRREIALDRCAQTGRRRRGLPRAALAGEIQEPHTEDLFVGAHRDGDSAAPRSEIAVVVEGRVREVARSRDGEGAPPARETDAGAIEVAPRVARHAREEKDPASPESIDEEAAALLPDVVVG